MCGPLDEEAAAYVLKELLRALRYLHHERKIHRDVKAGNLLLAADATVRCPPSFVPLTRMHPRRGL